VEIVYIIYLQQLTALQGMSYTRLQMGLKTVDNFRLITPRSIPAIDYRWVYMALGTPILGLPGIVFKFLMIF
jgi:hypothetical protein